MTQFHERSGKTRAAISAARAVFTLAIFLATAVPLFSQDSSLAFKRAQHLRHGINLSHWFAQVFDPKGYTKEHFDTYDTAQDMALIKAMDFDHVRFTMNCDPMFRRGQADRIPAEYLAIVDTAVKMILDQNLSIIIDIHPESDFKQKLASDDGFVEQFADYWRALAKHYSSLDPDKVFFEILNEPEFKDRYRWMGVQTRLARAIREGAPNHTIIAAGANWSSSNELLFLEPLRDTNVIYNFHFYDPHIFTHQGATWTTNFQHYLMNLPYPSTPENVRSAESEVPDPINQQTVARYGLDQWNAARIDAEIVQAATWGKHWNVPLTCNEFGVYRATANPADRAAWLHDVRITLEKYNIGWTMWDYAGGFSVVTRNNGVSTPDPVTLKALGLTVPSPPPSTKP
ncbi:MAG TPA: cellulase family glycosylhydrolase [Candidatus Dormibacteraeota bacterium]|nr:cellulase family glycosylhydrolase [Candidatus Dormibacteraeota bacterium]